MARGRIDVEPLPLRLLSGNDQVDVIAASQTVIGHRQQAIGVGRQIDPNHVGFLVRDMIDEAGILMGKPIVILPPHLRCQQIIQRSDRLAPGNVPADLQPFRVLIEHRVDDVDERLVAGEQAMAPGEQVSLKPALAHVLAEHLHDAAIGLRSISTSSTSAIHSLPETSYTASSRFEAVSSGPNSRKFCWPRFSFITSRRNVPSTRVSLPP